MEAQFPHPEEGDLIEDASDWILCQVIRREAEGLIGGGAATRPVTVLK